MFAAILLPVALRVRAEPSHMPRRRLTASVIVQTRVLWKSEAGLEMDCY